MQFDLTAEQVAFRDELRAFFRRELTRQVSAVHRNPNDHGMWPLDFMRT